MNVVVVVFQLCVERCPDRHLTLVKAKVGNKDDHEYYRQYCKEGVDFAKLVSGQVVVAFLKASNDTLKCCFLPFRVRHKS